MFHQVSKPYRLCSSMLWRSVFEIIGWLGAIAAFALFPFWLALPFVIGFDWW
jgi:hypothetical protein